MKNSDPPELWVWAEYYCPWCYIAAVRLDRIRPEFEGRVRLRERAFPLEVYGGGPPDRHELELEMWLAAVQEPAAEFQAFRGEDWPTTTLPAFAAAWCAARQDEAAGHAFDLRIRRAFFAEGRNIGRPEVIRELAVEAGLEMHQFDQHINSGAARAAVLAEGQLGKQRWGVRSTPTLMRADGYLFPLPMAAPDIRDGRIVAVGRAPCCGADCDEQIRDLFHQVVQSASSHLEDGRGETG